MAVAQQQTLPAPFLTDVTKQYAKDIGALTAAPLKTAAFAPQVAGQHQLQTDAAGLASTGLGAYEPYITQAGAYSGPTGYQDFMSPYQTDIIDTTLAEFDKQAAARQQGIADLATRTGNLGGGREGVMRSEYQTQSDLNRAQLQAQLLGQGFSQAQGLAGQAFGQQQGLASLVPSLVQSRIGTLGQVGATQQAQTQAELDATRETARMRAYEPYERLGYLGSGITGMLGGYPGQYQSQITPNPTPLQTALGIGSTAAGIYGALNPRPMFG